MWFLLSFLVTKRKKVVMKQSTSLAWFALSRYKEMWFPLLSWKLPWDCSFFWLFKTKHKDCGVSLSMHITKKSVVSVQISVAN